MRQTPLAKAKAHLSELVDAAEHRGQRTLILRHGKPAAALVPVEVARERDERPLMTEKEAHALMDRLLASAPGESTLTIAEALGRDRREAE
jgi:prevent-host-death family protein